MLPIFSYKIEDVFETSIEISHPPPTIGLKSENTDGTLIHDVLDYTLGIKILTQMVETFKEKPTMIWTLNLLENFNWGIYIAKIQDSVVVFEMPEEHLKDNMLYYIDTPTIN